MVGTYIAGILTIKLNMNYYIIMRRRSKLPIKEFSEDGIDCGRIHMDLIVQGQLGLTFNQYPIKIDTTYLFSNRSTMIMYKEGNNW